MEPFSEDAVDRLSVPGISQHAVCCRTSATCFVLRGYKLTKALGKAQNRQDFLTLDDTTELRVLVFSLIPLFSLTLIPDWTWNNKPWAPGSSEHPCSVAHLERGCTSLLGMKTWLWVHCGAAKHLLVYQPFWALWIIAVHWGRSLLQCSEHLLFAKALCSLLSQLGRPLQISQRCLYLSFQWALPGCLPFQCSLFLPISIFSISVFLPVCPILLIRFIACLMSSVKCRVHEGSFSVDSSLLTKSLPSTEDRRKLQVLVTSFSKCRVSHRHPLVWFFSF